MNARLMASLVLIGALTACGASSTEAETPTDVATEQPTTQAPEPAPDPLIAVKEQCLAVANDAIALLTVNQQFATTSVAAIETMDPDNIADTVVVGEGLKSKWDALQSSATVCDPISPSFSQAVAEYSNATDDMVNGLSMTGKGIEANSPSTLEVALDTLQQGLTHMNTASDLLDSATAEVQAYGS